MNVEFKIGDKIRTRGLDDIWNEFGIFNETEYSIEDIIGNSIKLDGIPIPFGPSCFHYFSLVKKRENPTYGYLLEKMNAKI